MKQLLRLTTLFSSCAALALTAVAGPEPLPSGKEMKQVAPAPVPECDFNWSGFYIGVKGGYGWSTGDLRVDQLPDNDPFMIVQDHHDLSTDGFIGGGEIGFNWAWNHFLFGAAADFFGSDMSDHFDRFVDVPGSTGTPPLLSSSQDINWFGTVRGRVGFIAGCRFLIYGTGGFAYGDVDDHGTLDYRPNGGSIFYPAHRSNTETGWTAGGGLEYAIGHHWSVKVEYLYVDLGNNTAIGNPVPANPPFAVKYNWDNQFHTVTGGLNFKF
jgi:outer membrane immunogenic protein